MAEQTPVGSSAGAEASSPPASAAVVAALTAVPAVEAPETATAAAATETVLRVHGLEALEQDAATEAQRTGGAPLVSPSAIPAAAAVATPSAVSAAPPSAATTAAQQHASNGNSGPVAAAASSSSSSSSSSAASSHSSAGTAAAASRNPHAGELAAALLPLLRLVSPEAAASASSSSLDALLSLVQALPYDTKAAFFAHACTLPLTTGSAGAASAAASSSSSSAQPLSAQSRLFNAVLSYFLDDNASGSAQDPLCRFLYDAYWQASTKMDAAGTPVPRPGGAANGLAAPGQPSLPSAHLFLINLLPVLIWKFLVKHAAARVGLTGAQPYAGLFTVFLALYNTERVLTARAATSGGSGSSILSLPPVPDLPALRALQAGKPFEFVTASSSSGSSDQSAAVAAATARNQQQQCLTTLPALSSDATSPSSAHLLLHVLLLKHAQSLPLLLPESRQTAVYLAGLATDPHTLGTLDVFTEALRREGNFALSAQGTVQLPVSWNTAWSSAAAPSSPSTASVRFGLTKDILQDFVIELTYALRQTSEATTTTTSQQQQQQQQSSSSLLQPSWHNVVLVALRGVHCRALEDMLPEILLQTTCLLQLEEDRTTKKQQQQQHLLSPLPATSKPMATTA